MTRIFSIINTDEPVPAVLSTGGTNIARGQYSLDGTEQLMSVDFQNPNITAIENAGYVVLTEEEARLQASEWDEE